MAKFTVSNLCLVSWIKTKRMNSLLDGSRVYKIGTLKKCVETY